MIEHPRGQGLLLEATNALGVASQDGGQDLDCDFAPDARVPSPIDVPHSSRTDRADDLVMPDLRTCR